MTDEERRALIPGEWVEVLRDDGKTTTHHQIKYAPWKLGHGEWVIGLEGIAGGYLLSRVVSKDPVTSRMQAAEIARLRAGLAMISQIIHGSTRMTRRIAEATLAGADMQDEDTAIEVCEGTWKPTVKQ